MQEPTESLNTLLRVWNQHSSHDLDVALKKYQNYNQSQWTSEDYEDSAFAFVYAKYKFPKRYAYIHLFNAYGVQDY